MISKENYNFLKDIKNNNNRDWFNSHKEAYHIAHENIIAFADLLIVKMKKFDNLDNLSGKKSVFRIYNDVRFSKDKTPYKTHWGVFLKRATEELRGGYYVHIKPGNTFLGCGFWKPNSEDLNLIRAHINQDDLPIRQILTSNKFKKHFGSIKGDEVKTSPRGYSKDHPSIDLIRKKGFVGIRQFDDSEVFEPGFIDEIVKSFKAIRPFFDYMSYVLTHDLNGVSLLK